MDEPILMKLYTVAVYNMRIITVQTILREITNIIGWDFKFVIWLKVLCIFCTVFFFDLSSFMLKFY